jgi:hypothetical protein
MDQDHKCIKTTKEETQVALFLFGANRYDMMRLEKINGHPIFGYPGPISGHIPKYMIPVKEPKFLNSLPETEMTKMKKNWFYYISLVTDLHRVWNHCLTVEQREEIRSMVDSSMNDKKE